MKVVEMDNPIEGTLLDLHEKETDTEFSDCETEIVGVENLTLSQVSQNGMEEKNSPSNGGDDGAVGNNGDLDLDKERDQLDAERRQLEEERLQLKREIEQFEELQRIAVQKELKANQRALLRIKEANRNIENTNRKLIETEKRREGAELSVRGLEQRLCDADLSLKEKKEQMKVADEHLTQSRNATKEMQKDVDKLNNLATIAEGRLATIRRKKGKGQGPATPPE